jgi:hypothetical protein
MVPPVFCGTSAGLAASGEDALGLLLQPLPASASAQPKAIDRQAARRSLIV